MGQIHMGQISEVPFTGSFIHWYQCWDYFLLCFQSSYRRGSIIPQIGEERQKASPFLQQVSFEVDKLPLLTCSMHKLNKLHVI